MKNYEKVAELQRKIGEENTEKAIKAIYYLYEHNKLITVKELMQLTGLSRSYFYKNAKVNSVLKKVLIKQKGDEDISSKTEVFNIAVSKSNELLERQIEILKHRCNKLMHENSKLKNEIERLKK